MQYASTRAFVTLILALSFAGCAVEDEATKPDSGGLGDATAAADRGTATDGGLPDQGQQSGGVLMMPGKLGLDLSKTATTMGAIGSVARSVAQAAGFSAELDQVRSIFVAPIDALKIPLSASTKTFSAKVTIGSGSKAIQLPIKVDFADFDADGDGKLDGCSGHTGVLPICLRVWIDGTRYLSGRLDRHPTQQSAGAGRFMAVKIPSLPGGEAGTTVSVIYDHHNPAQRSTESFWGSPSNDPQHGKWASIRHLRIEQQGATAGAQKTINLHDVMPALAGASLQYLGRYRQDGTLWFGSVKITGYFTQLGLKAFGATCVDLTSGQTVASTKCTAAGVDFSNISAVAAGTDLDVTLPAGFPVAPTF
jgi:hypothetical protein